MSIPTYDQENLPCVVFPLTNWREPTKRYLGNTAISGEIYAELSLKATSDEQMALFDDFWMSDCNYGLEPFLIALPVFGMTIDTEYPRLLVQFVGDLKDTKNETSWDIKRKVKILGVICYVKDDDDNFIVSDSGDYTISDTGDYISTGNNIDTYKETIYG